MRKLLLVTLLSLTTLSGCLSTQPKSYEDKGYSVAKQKLVSLGAPQDYITDGKTPLEAKFEGQSRMDAISRHAGLATAVSTLSITSTFMATMASSDVDDRTVWKSYLARPIVFLKTTEKIDYNFQAKIMKNFLIRNNYDYDQKTGYFLKEGKKFVANDSKKTVTENGVEYNYAKVELLEVGSYKNQYDVVYDFYKENQDKLMLYYPAINGEPAYVIDKGQKHYFVAQK